MFATPFNFRNLSLMSWVMPSTKFTARQEVDLLPQRKNVISTLAIP